MKAKYIRWLSNISLFLGTFLIILYFAQGFFVGQTVKQTEHQYELINKRRIDINNATETEFKYEDIDDVNFLTSFRSYVTDLSDSVVGKIIIPSLDIDLPILKGVTNVNLNAGATTMRADQLMGKGNYPLAGHIMKNKSLLFGSLMDIQIGAKVYITDKETVYEYEIYNTELVADTAVELIEDYQAEKRGGPIISLMTCYHSSRTGKRFFAYGDLVRSFSIDEEIEIEDMKEEVENVEKSE